MICVYVVCCPHAQTALGFETEDDVYKETSGLGGASLLQVLYDERARNAELVRQLTQEKAEKDKVRWTLLSNI
jgi:hypothetical protein